MVEETLTSADFESVNVDSYGRFTFSNALANLRRSMKGLHNKIFPVFVLNDEANPAMVRPVMPSDALQVNGVASMTAVAVTTLYTVPVGKTLYITSAGVCGIFGATDTVLLVASDDGTGTYQNLAVIEGLGVTMFDNQTAAFPVPVRVSSGRVVRAQVTTTAATAGKGWFVGFLV